MEKRVLLRLVGRYPYWKLKIVNEFGEVQINQPGEVCRGYCIMQCYWNDPEKPPLSDSEGWLHSGDNGQMDEQGCAELWGGLRI
jgi:fatty-acyl-CoA synthase